MVSTSARRWCIKELPQLFDMYRDQGFQILAFPCNQFGMQEPGTHEEILEFVKKFDVDMAQKLVFFEKSDVNGANAREVYGFIKPLALNPDGTTDIRWNFSEYNRTNAFVYCDATVFSFPWRARLCRAVNLMMYASDLTVAFCWSLSQQNFLSITRETPSSDTWVLVLST
jgi:Glutathione peroxidase